MKNQKFVKLKNIDWNYLWCYNCYAYKGNSNSETSYMQKHLLIQDYAYPCVICTGDDSDNIIFKELTPTQLDFLFQLKKSFIDKPESKNPHRYISEVAGGFGIYLFDPYHLDIDMLNNYEKPYQCPDLGAGINQYYQIKDDVDAYLKKYNIIPMIYQSDEEIKADWSHRWTY